LAVGYWPLAKIKSKPSLTQHINDSTHQRINGSTNKKQPTIRKIIELFPDFTLSENTYPYYCIMKAFYLLIFFLSLCFQTYAQVLNRCDNYIYDPNIQSVMFYKSGSVNSYPMINLNNPEESLTMYFDDISGIHRELHYTVIHCDKNWTPSRLYKNEYIRGIDYERIENHEVSFNTYQNFIHYHLVFPTYNMQPLIAGNYLLIVYPENDPEKILLTRRFYVYTQQVGISASVKQPVYAKYKRYKQEIALEISYNNISINPMEDLEVCIRQNYRWDNMISGLKPQYIKGNILVYDYKEETLFDACSEFRYLDIRSVRYAGRGIEKFYLDTIYHQIPYVDEDHSYKEYQKWEDINGNRIITGESSDIPMSELDYFLVHFRLTTPYPKDEEIYIFGALSDWRLQEQFQMQYNPRNKLYEAQVLLKQGFYNFQYVLHDTENNTIDCTRFEGSHFQTENNYIILVYLHDRFINTDIIAGISIINSGIN
jgi:hypothetical protein